MSADDVDAGPAGGTAARFDLLRADPMDPGQDRGLLRRPASSLGFLADRDRRSDVTAFVYSQAGTGAGAWFAGGGGAVVASLVLGVGEDLLHVIGRRPPLAGAHRSDSVTSLRTAFSRPG